MHRPSTLPRCPLAALTFVALCAIGGQGLAETTPPQPAAAQPTLPGPAAAAPAKPDLPAVEEMVTKERPHVARKRVSRPLKRYSHHTVQGRGRVRELDRPALAGVTLVAPLPPPPEPPHFVMPVPAYPLDSLAAGFFTPPPPIVCHPTRRDPAQPDPRLYKEGPVECEPDNP